MPLLLKIDTDLILTFLSQSCVWL